MAQRTVPDKVTANKDKKNGLIHISKNLMLSRGGAGAAEQVQ